MIDCKICGSTIDTAKIYYSLSRCYYQGGDSIFFHEECFYNAAGAEFTTEIFDKTKKCPECNKDMSASTPLCADCILQKASDINLSPHKYAKYNE